MLNLQMFHKYIACLFDYLLRITRLILYNIIICRINSLENTGDDFSAANGRERRRGAAG